MMLPPQLLQVLVFQAPASEAEFSCSAEVGHDRFDDFLVPLIGLHKGGGGQHSHDSPGVVVAVIYVWVGNRPTDQTVARTLPIISLFSPEVGAFEDKIYKV